MNSGREFHRGISVVLCTHNGASNLPETLRHLAAQQVPDDLPWEVVFVDNASTDKSVEVAQAEWDRFPELNEKFVCLQEAQPGKYFALQTAMRYARYEYFVICDDDNWLKPDYLRKVAEILDARPEVGAVGGRGIPVTKGNVPLPDWFDQYQEGYAVGPQAPDTGDVTYKGHLWGAGMGSRTSLYRPMYAKYPSFLLELHDASVMSTEDSEYCLRLVLRGYRLYYDDTLVYSHLIPAGKLIPSFIKKLYKRHHASYAVNGKYFLIMKVLKAGRINKLRLWTIRLTGFLGSLIAHNHKLRIRAHTKRNFLKQSSVGDDIVGHKILAFAQEGRFLQ